MTGRGCIIVTLIGIGLTIFNPDNTLGLKVCVMSCAVALANLVLYYFE